MTRACTYPEAVDVLARMGASVPEWSLDDTDKIIRAACDIDRDRRCITDGEVVRWEFRMRDLWGNGGEFGEWLACSKEEFERWPKKSYLELRELVVRQPASPPPAPARVVAWRLADKPGAGWEDASMASAEERQRYYRERGHQIELAYSHPAAGVPDDVMAAAVALVEHARNFADQPKANYSHALTVATFLQSLPRTSAAGGG